MSIVYFDSW